MDNHQDKLRTFIFELSIPSADPRIDDRIQQLKTIYEGDFRYYYSEIFGTITAVKNDDKYDLQVLTENIRKIFDVVKSEYNNGDTNKDFFLTVKKLYDHINLDVSRINYTEALINKITEQNKLTNEELRKINDKAEKMQREYITILGIFAAIIIAFVSGMTFSTSVLNNIDKVNVYHLTFIGLLIAVILFNLLNLLLNFLMKINDLHLGRVYKVTK